MHGPASGHARGVDDDVEPAVRGDDRGHRGRHRGLVAHVDRVIDVAVHIEAHRGRTLLDEPLHARLADPRRPARHQRDLALEPSHGQIILMERSLDM